MYSKNIFKKSSEVIGQAVPACEYYFQYNPFRVIQPSELRAIYHEADRYMYLDEVVAGELFKRRILSIQMSKDRDALVYQDTGELVTKEDLKNLAGQPRRQYVVGKNPDIPESTFRKTPFHNNYEVPGFRPVVKFRQWYDKYAFVFVTEDEIVYVSREDYKKIQFDRDAKLHFIEGKGYVTTKGNLEYIRYLKQKEVGSNNNSNNNNIDLTELASKLAVNSPYASKARAAAMTRAIILRDDTSETVYIYPRKRGNYSNKQDTYQIVQSLNLLKNQLVVNSFDIPIIVKNIDGNDKNVGVILQNNFPGIVIRNYIGTYHGVEFFCDGKSDESIRITSKKYFSKIAAQASMTTIDFLAHRLREVGIESHFIITSEEPLSLIFEFKHPKIKFTPHMTELDEIFDLLFSDDEQLGNEGKQKREEMINYFRQLNIIYLSKYNDAEFYYNGDPNVSIQVAWSGIFSAKGHSVIEFLNLRIREVGLQNFLEIIPIENLSSFNLRFKIPAGITQFTLDFILHTLFVKDLGIDKSLKDELERANLAEANQSDGDNVDLNMQNRNNNDNNNNNFDDTFVAEFSLEAIQKYMTPEMEKAIEALVNDDYLDNTFNSTFEDTSANLDLFSNNLQTSNDQVDFQHQQDFYQGIVDNNENVDDVNYEQIETITNENIDTLAAINYPEQDIQCIAALEAQSHTGSNENDNNFQINNNEFEAISNNQNNFPQPINNNNNDDNNQRSAASANNAEQTNNGIRFKKILVGLHASWLFTYDEGMKAYVLDETIQKNKTSDEIRNFCSSINRTLFPRMLLLRKEDTIELPLSNYKEQIKLPNQKLIQAFDYKEDTSYVPQPKLDPKIVYNLEAACEKYKHEEFPMRFSFATHIFKWNDHDAYVCCTKKNPHKLLEIFKTNVKSILLQKQLPFEVVEERLSVTKEAYVKFLNECINSSITRNQLKSKMQFEFKQPSHDNAFSAADVNESSFDNSNVNANINLPQQQESVLSGAYAGINTQGLFIPQINPAKPARKFNSPQGNFAKNDVLFQNYIQNFENQAKRQKQSDDTEQPKPPF